VFPAVGLNLRPRDRAGCREGLVDLIVQFGAVSDDHKSPLAGQGAENLLGEEHHGEALAAPLRVPEDPELLGRFHIPGFPQLDHLGNRLVHAQVLVVLGDLLDQATPCQLEQGEVLHDVEQPTFVAEAANGRLQAGRASLGLIVDPPPLEEVFPRAGQGAHAGL